MFMIFEDTILPEATAHEEFNISNVPNCHIFTPPLKTICVSITDRNCCGGGIGPEKALNQC